jgi:hypothetical protein
MLLKHSQRVLLLGHQVSSGLPLTCHKSLTTKARAKSSNHLDAAFTTKLSKKEGSPHPPHKAVVVVPYQAEGSMTCRWATKIPRGRYTEIQSWGSLKNQHKVTIPCSHTLSRASLALHLIKLMLNLRIWSMSSLVCLENFSSVAFHELQQSQMARGEALYGLETHYHRFNRSHWACMLVVELQHPPFVDVIAPTYCTNGCRFKRCWRFSHSNSSDAWNALCMITTLMHWRLWP